MSSSDKDQTLPQEQKKHTPSTAEILQKAKSSALRGGISGAMAMTIQVCSLMWMRTTMNYQYRYGTTTSQAMKTLYSQGGVRRFYRGVGPALLQGPISRFGDTAANTGALALLEHVDIPTPIKTILASATAAGFRIFLMPIDALKTTLQVEGKQGIPILGNKIKKSGPIVLWHGSLATVSATFVGHYPWFATYNFLNATLKQRDDPIGKLSRSAFIGFVSSVVSDTCSNSLRVLKTYRQTQSEPVSYTQAFRNIVDADGYAGLFGRGLKTRIMTNGMQGLLFSVLWRFFQDQFKARDEKNQSK